MESSYPILYRPGSAEETVKKSRFLACALPISSEEEAAAEKSRVLLTEERFNSVRYCLFWQAAEEEEKKPVIRINEGPRQEPAAAEKTELQDEAAAVQDHLQNLDKADQAELQSAIEDVGKELGKRPEDYSDEELGFKPAEEIPSDKEQLENMNEDERKAAFAFLDI